MIKMTATRLRQDIYNILDNVIETGIPVEIERKGGKLKIFPEKRKNKLDNLKKRELVVGDPEAIINIDWMKEWNEGEKI
jgi:hypothetical protein